MIRHVVLWLVLFVVLAGSGCSSKPPEADEIAVKALHEPVLENIAVEILHEPTLEYRYVQSFKEGFAAVGNLSVRMEGTDIGYIDKSGNVVIPTEHYYVYWAFQDGGKARNYSEGLVAVSVGDGDWRERKWGYKDKAGRVTIPFEYNGADDFSEGLAAVGDGETGKSGFIDKTGKVVIPFEYDYVRSFSEGLAAARLGDWKTGKWGFIDKTGRVVIPFEYDNDNKNGRFSYIFSEGLASVYKTGQGWGYIDKTGKVVIPFEYSGVGAFSEGMACVSYDADYSGKFGVINTDGKLVIPAIYDNEPYYDVHGDFFFLPGFSEGLLRVSRLIDAKNSIYDAGYIDKTGETIIPFGGAAFSEGLAAVSRGNRETGFQWGYIDKTGKTVVPFEYDSAQSFSEGLAWVQKNGKWGILAISAKSNQR